MHSVQKHLLTCNVLSGILCLLERNIMTHQLVTLEQDIYGLQPAFTRISVDKSIAFEREAEFALQIIYGNDYLRKIAEANRQSVKDAVTNIAAIGISLNPAKKQGYLVPRKNKVCLDISYMGLIDLAMATGSVRWAQAAVVHQEDTFILNGYDRAPSHQFSPFSTERGPVVGVYAVVKTADCEYLTHTMPIDDVYAIRDRSEAWKAFIRDNSKKCPWNTDAGEMVKKTCIKQAYKYWPKTDRLETAIHYLNTEGGEGIELATPEPKVINPETSEISLPIYPEERFQKNLPTWRSLIESGKKTAAAVIATASSAFTLTEEQKAMINATVTA